jgi:putative nucleotidyltransferase with HDIG domain
MKKILFVDDETSELEQLRRALEPMRKEWDMGFATSGQAGLALLHQEQHDIVVVDMQMPVMNGTQFLEEVRKHYPQIIRIAVSGEQRLMTSFQASAFAHQFHSKPNDAGRLIKVLRRACWLSDLLAESKLVGVIARLKTVPSLPTLYVELTSLLEKEDVAIKNIGEIIARDMGMSAKVLQLVNSAFFGLDEHVSHPQQAVVLLGTDTVRSLVLSADVFAQFESSKLDFLSLSRLWDHSIAVGGYAKRIAKHLGADATDVDNAFIAGLLHDVGKLVLGDNFPEHYFSAIGMQRRHRIEIYEAEWSVFGSSHAEVGAFLLGIWGLPDAIVEAVALHHKKSLFTSNQSPVTTAVFIADALEHEFYSGGDSGSERRVDEEMVNRLGLAHWLPIWRSKLVEKINHDTASVESAR